MGDEQRRDGALERAARVRGLLEDARGTLRDEVGRVEDPRAEALFETTAEVLGGLITAYRHYEEGSEEAWRSDSTDTPEQTERAEHPTQPAEGGREETER